MMDRPIATVEDAATIMQSSREHNHGKQKPKAKGISGPASANGNTPAPTPPPHGPAASASDEFSRNGTPSSQVTAGDDGRDYRTMTKSEKMSASMKSKYRFRMSLEHRANPRQTAGRTATWLAQSRSVRLLSQPRRPRRPPTSRAWEGPSLPNRCPRCRRASLPIAGRLQPREKSRRDQRHRGSDDCPCSCERDCDGLMK